MPVSFGPRKSSTNPISTGPQLRVKMPSVHSRARLLSCDLHTSSAVGASRQAGGGNGCCAVLCGRAAVDPELLSAMCSGAAATEQQGRPPCRHSSRIAARRWRVPSTAPAHSRTAAAAPGAASWRKPLHRCRLLRTWRLGVAAAAIVAQVCQHARQAGPAKDEAACSGQDGQ